MSNTPFDGKRYSELFNVERGRAYLDALIGDMPEDKRHVTILNIMSACIDAQTEMNTARVEKIKEHGGHKDYATPFTLLASAIGYMMGKDVESDPDSAHSPLVRAFGSFAAAVIINELPICGGCQYKAILSGVQHWIRLNLEDQAPDTIREAAREMKIVAGGTLIQMLTDIETTGDLSRAEDHAL